MEKKFTSLKLILSELEPDQDIDSSKKFQTSFFIFSYIFSMIDYLTLEGGIKSNKRLTLRSHEAKMLEKACFLTL